MVRNNRHGKVKWSIWLDRFYLKRYLKEALSMHMFCLSRGSRLSPWSSAGGISENREADVRLVQLAGSCYFLILEQTSFSDSYPCIIEGYPNVR